MTEIYFPDGTKLSDIISGVWSGTATSNLDMDNYNIQSIQYADAESNNLPGLFTQHDRDANGWDYYSSFHSYIPEAIAASQSTHRIFGISSEIHTEGLAHSLTDFTHTVALFGAVVSGKEPGNDSCQIWGLNTLIESQYDSGDSKGFEQHMQGYECDVNRALPHVMKEDGGILYKNYYSSGDKGTVLNNATDILVALNYCLGVNVTGISSGNLGAAYNVAGGGTGYWNVGVLLDHPFQYAAIIIGDGQKVMWKNNYTGNYETRFLNIEGEFNIYSGANTTGTGNIKLWSNFDIDLNCGTGGQVNLNGDINLADFDILSVDNFYMDGILDISDSTGTYYSTQQQIGVNSIFDINAAGQFIFKKSLNVWNTNITNVANPTTNDHADNKGARDTAIAVHTAAYGHLSTAQKTDLTDGGSTSLHKHFPFTEDISWNKTNPGMVFDSSDMIYYDKTLNRLNVVIGGTIRVYCDSTGWH